MVTDDKPLTRTLIALITDAPDDSLAAVTQCSAEVLLSDEVMAHDVTLKESIEYEMKSETANDHIMTKQLVL